MRPRPNQKFTLLEAIQIRSELDRGVPAQEIANRKKVDRVSINKIGRGEIWRPRLMVALTDSEIMTLAKVAAKARITIEEQAALCLRKGLSKAVTP